MQATTIISHSAVHRAWPWKCECQLVGKICSQIGGFEIRFGWILNMEGLSIITITQILKKLFWTMAMQCSHWTLSSASCSPVHLECGLVVGGPYDFTDLSPKSTFLFWFDYSLGWTWSWTVRAACQLNIKRISKVFKLSLFSPPMPECCARVVPCAILHCCDVNW